VVQTSRLHAEGEYQKAETEEHQSARFAGEFEEAPRAHLKGL
jgi:hypothetical protein